MAQPSYVANYVPGLISRGYSMEGALNTVRSYGYDVTQRTFSRLWGEAQHHMALREGFQSGSINRTPLPSEIGVATRPRARGLLYNIEVAVENPDTKEVEFHTWGVRSNRPLTLNTALKKAVESWTASQERGRGTPPGRALGGMVTSVLNLVGPDE